MKVYFMICLMLASLDLLCPRGNRLNVSEGDFTAKDTRRLRKLRAPKNRTKVLYVTIGNDDHYLEEMDREDDNVVRIRQLYNQHLPIAMYHDESRTVIETVKLAVIAEQLCKDKKSFYVLAPSV